MRRRGHRGKRARREDESEALHFGLQFNCLHLSQRDQRLSQLLLVVIWIHRCLLIFQHVDLLLQLVFLLEQRALGGIVGSLLVRAECAAG